MLKKESTPVAEKNLNREKVRRNETIPFSVTPPQYAFGIGQKNKQILDGSELFSKFTADVIKEDVIFTR